ncbi:MAG: hypothetical protein IJW55_04645 [Clostridia bacterium]|nr:hypothetical protein [Clostridia bacterium]
MKKLLVALLTLSLVLALAVPAFAEETNVVGYSADRIEKITDWSEIPDIIKYDDYMVNPEAYKVLDADGLMKLSNIVNTGDPLEGVTIYLAYDINMEGKEFVSIGKTGSLAFKGTLDGQGHVIDNLKTMPFGDSGVIVAGLIGQGTGATVKNVILGSGCEITSTVDADSRIGGIIGNSNGCTVDNCYVLATVNGSRYTGGVVGFINTTTEDVIQNCTFAGSTSDNTRGSGGIVGTVAQANTKVLNCRNTGTVNSATTASAYNTCAGGIVGRCWAAGLTIDGCINNGTITAATYGGGILGGLQLANATVTNCINYGTVTGEGTDNGIVGMVQDTFSAGISECVDKAGQDDATLSTVPTVTPDYPTQEEIDAAHNNNNTQGGDEGGNEQGGNEQGGNEQGGNEQGGNEQGGSKDTEPVTEAPTSATTTEAPADTDEESGCASSVFGGLAMIVMTAGAALTLCKKKKD